MYFAPFTGSVWTMPAKDIGNVGHVFIAGIKICMNRLQMKLYRRQARIRTILSLRQSVENLKILRYKQPHND
jgi:hypothetical protein